MPNRETSPSWPGGGLLSVGLVVAYVAAIAHAQSDASGGAECESLRAQVGDLRRIVLDTAVLKLVKNDVQILANCMPAHGVVKFSIPDLSLEDVLRIRKPLTIHGNGASVQCPDDEKKGALKIRSNDVTISDIVFEGCNLNSTVGLIDVKNSKNVTLTDVKFVGNKNIAGTGCISVAESAIELLRIEARNNNGALGGVLSAEMDSKIMIMDSDFSGNGAFVKGGAVYFHNSNASITDVTFGENKALKMGGAVFSEGVVDSELILENVTFHGNMVNGEDGQGETHLAGGGVALQGPKLKADIRKTVFARNSAPIAGGGLTLDNCTAVSILDSHFNENFAGRGGSIFAQIDGLLKIESSVFSENEATKNGGAVSLLAENAEFSVKASNFQKNKAWNGGAIDITQGGRIDVSECSFTNNTSSGSGGAMSLQLSTLLINGTSFSGNAAMEFGGAVRVSDTNLTVTQSSFTGNIARSNSTGSRRIDKGGAIFSIHIRPYQAPHLARDTTFSPAVLQLAAAFEKRKEKKEEENAFVKLRHVEFKHNYAEGGGGALDLVGVDLEMEGGLFRNNSAGDNGGAISLIQLPGSFLNATIKFVTFHGNEAILGGAIFSQRRDLHLSHCKFRANIARHGGGALYCEDSGLNLIHGHRDSVFTVHFSHFSENEAGESHHGKKDSDVTSTHGRGGAVLMTGLGLVADFKSCTFSKNAAGSGGSVHMQDVKNLSLVDSGFWMGSALTGGALTVISAGDSFTATNVSFVGNAARWGGAISLSSSTGTRFDGLFEGAVSLTQAHFVENVATRGGGAVNVRERSLECKWCLFKSNRGADGGAFRALSASNITLLNSTVTECFATRSGGGISLEDALFFGRNVSILKNTAIKSGGGLAMHFATFASNQLIPWRCRSCIVQGNKATKGGGIHVSTDRSRTQDCQDLGAMSLVNNLRQRLELLEDCKQPPKKSTSLGARIFLDSTTFAQNIAHDSGSDIFLSNFKESICCDNQCWTTASGLEEVLQKCAIRDKPGKESVPLGTLFDTVLISPSEVTGHASGEELPAVKVTTLDAFGQISVDNVTLRLEATTPGGELFGNHVTREGVLMKGEINVTGVFVRAFPGSYNLSFQLTSEDGGRSGNAFLLVEIRECFMGEIPREGGLRCDTCADDFFSFDVTDASCTPCPVEKARCSGGTFVPLDGFWHSNPRSSQVHACLTTEACTYPNRTDVLFEASLNSSGDYPQCAKGYRGVFCGSCHASHGKSRYQCTECQGKLGAGVGIGVVMLALAILSLIYVRSAAKYSQQVLGTQSTATNQHIAPSAPQELVLGGITVPQGETPRPSAHQRQKRISEIFKILVNFFQVTGTAAAINVGWSDSMLALFTTWDMISGVADGNSFFPFECAFSSRTNGIPSSIQTSIFLGFLPIMVWATLTILCAGHALKSKTTFQNFKLWSCVALLAVLQASYISATRTLVRIFYCVDASPLTGLFWVQDTSVVCYTGSHAFLVGCIGVPGLLLISMGFPGWLLFKLTRSTESLESEDVVSRYGFLYRAYKKNAAAWEVVVLLRKAFLATIVVFGRTLGEGIQGNLAVFIMVGSITLQLNFQPFLESKLNNMELGSLGISTLAFTIGNLVDQPKMTDRGRVAMSVIFIAIVGIYVAYMLKQIFDTAFLDLREWLKNENPRSALPAGNFVLLIVAMNSLTKKTKAIVKEKQVRFVKKVSRNLSCVLSHI